MQNSAVAYSFLTDTTVPKFDPPEHFTIMDAECGLCANGALWIARSDHKRKFRIIPMQSELGGALMRHYGMSPDDPLSWLYVNHGLAYSSLDAIIRVGRELGGVWNALSVFRVLPRRMQDYLYGVVARNRFRLLGRKSFCELGDPAVQIRILR